MGDSAIKNREFEDSLLYFNISSNSFWLDRCCQSLISLPQVFDCTSLNRWNGGMAQIGHKVANHMFLPYLVKRPIPFFSLIKVVCFEDLQALGDVYATIRQDRSDQGSSPWSRPPRSPGQTSSARPRSRSNNFFEVALKTHDF